MFEKISRPLLISILGFILLGVIYVGNTYSPSSYGIVLEQLKVKNKGLVFGEPRAIRSDEWAVVTPLTQATVNNDFKRYNESSFYKEDLRINYGLPIKDWGMAFKPTMWGYLFLDPAYAYSLHWYLIFVIFILGYTLLFEKFEVSYTNSFLLSFGLYFTGFTQFWWNEKGPIFAFFPWIIIILISAKMKTWIKLLLLYWISTSWLITNFYPPIFISLGFVGAVLIVALDSSWLKIKKLIPLIIVIILTAGTTIFYLKDYIFHTMSTIYPGQRNVSGGSVPLKEYLSQIFPYISFNRKYESFSQNICEVGTVGMYFSLLFFFHIEYTKNSITKVFTNRILRILFVGLLLMTSRMLLPIPGFIGKVFLWNNVQPERMEYAEGLLFILIIVVISNLTKLKINMVRVFMFTTTIIISWLIFKKWTIHDIRNDFIDLYIIPIYLFFLLIYYLKGKKIDSYNLKRILLLSSVTTGFLVLFPFNPIQKATSIFHIEKTKEIIRLNDMRDSNNGVLAVKGFAGATLNGLGYRSVSHVTAVPSLKFWRKKYSNLSENEFQNIFNRYSHITFIDETSPRVITPDNVGVPFRDFNTFKELIYNEIKSKYVALSINNNSSYSNKLENFSTNMKIKKIAILIGNNADISDGILYLKVCNARKCYSGQKSISESFDNDFFEISFKDFIEVKQGETLTYTYTVRNATTVPVAFWISANNKPVIKLIYQ